MINLMPYKQKQEIKEARANGILARWGIVVLVGFGLLVLILSGIYLVYVQTKADEIQKTSSTISRHFLS